MCSHKVFADNYKKAVAAFDKNAYNEASIHVRNLLQQQPNHISGRLLFAEILVYQNRPVDAQQQMDKALELGASDSQVLSLLARTEARSSAVNGSQNVSNDSPNNTQTVGNVEQIKNMAPELLLAEAIAKYSEQKWYAATIWFSAYLEKQPEDLSALVLLSKSYYMNANPSKSLEVLVPHAAKLTQDQNYAPAYAFALIENNKYQEAEALLQSQIDKYGNEPHTIMLLSKAYEKQDMLALAYDVLGVLDGDTSPQSQQMKMQLAYNMKRYVEALGVLHSMIDKKPQDRNLKLFEVQLLWDMGSLNEALVKTEQLVKSSSLQNETIEKAQVMRVELLHILERYEERNQEFLTLANHWISSTDKLIALARLQTRMDALEQAQQTFNFAIKNNPEDENLVFSYISFLNWQKDLSKAEKLLAQIDSNTVQDKARYFRLSGDLKFEMKDKLQAYNNYSQAILYSIDDINTLNKLSILSRETSRANTFGEMLKKNIAEYPEKLFLLEILAEHLMEQGLNEDAIFYYSQFVTKRIPVIKRAIALNNLGHLYNQIGKYELGIEHAKQAIALRDDIPTFHDTLGWGYALSGNYSQALDHLRKAHSMAEDSATISYHLAYTLKKLGRYDEAKRYSSDI